MKGGGGNTLLEYALLFRIYIHVIFSARVIHQGQHTSNRAGIVFAQSAETSRCSFGLFFSGCVLIWRKPEINSTPQKWEPLELV